MKFRLAALALLLAALPAIVLATPSSVTTTKKSAVMIGGGSFALVKGTKLDVISREGDTLLVKFHSSQGKIPLADTDYPVDATPAEPAAETAAIVAPAPAKTVAAAEPAKTATPPALNTSGQGQQPATNYGKAVQKAKQAAEANKSTHVDPTKGIMDDPKK
jgi:hypothetical protein